MFSRMFQVSGALLAGAILGAIASGNVANAATLHTLTPGGDNEPIVFGDVYSVATPGLNQIGFTHDYVFTGVVGGGVTSAVSNIQVFITNPNNAFSRVENLVLTWLGTPFFQVVTDGDGNFGNAANFFASLIPGPNTLRVTGDGIDGGSYQFLISFRGPDGSVDQLPLPPALLLFGSALVGLGVLGRRKRQGAAV